MSAGKKIIVFSPAQKGWGASVTATAISVSLEKETSGKILLIDFFQEISSIDHYLKRDLGETQETLPYEIFADSFDREQLMLFCRPLSKNLYFFKGYCGGLKNSGKLKETLEKFMKAAEEIFDLLVVKLDSDILREIDIDGDIYLPVFSYQSGIHVPLSVAGNFKWYRDLLEKRSHCFILNRISIVGGLRDDLRKWLKQGHTSFSLPDDPGIIFYGSRGSSLYSYLNREFDRERSAYRKRVFKIAEAILQACSIEKRRESNASH